jgi:hypothetical protein
MGACTVIQKAFEHQSFTMFNPDAEKQLQAYAILTDPRLRVPEELMMLIDMRRLNVQSFSRWGASGGPLLTTKEKGVRSEALVGMYVRGFPDVATRGQDFLVEQGVKLQFVPVGKMTGGQAERLL